MKIILQFAKKPLIPNLGHHKYKSSANKTVHTAGEAQDYLDRIAEKKGWDEY